MLRIGIGLPTNRLIKPKTAQSLMELVNHTRYDYRFIVSTRGYTTAENRNYISAKAVKAGCDYLFSVDDDMIYEPDTLDRLLAHQKDIIGGEYLTKYEVQETITDYLNGKETGLFECGALGSGLMLIKCDVFKKVPQPWYGYIWYDNGMIKESIDWFFCHKAREHGIKVWCDSEITAKHIGQYEY